MRPAKSPYDTTFMARGGFQDLQLVHRGRRHVVFRARWADDDRPLVLKTIDPATASPANAASLRHEHAVLTSLDLPGVVQALALDRLGEVPALVLADAGPHNLREWLRRKPMDPGAFLAMAVELARIVADLHRRNLIHRDLNPFNVVVGRDGQRVTLIDFDAATRVSGAAPRGVPGELEGTLLYIAPEQTGRTGGVVDHRADIYALGATFYEMLSGSPPFPAGDPGEIVHAHLAKAPVPLTSILPALPRTLSDLVLKLLAKAPGERYQSAEALLADLREGQRAWRDGGNIPDFELARADLVASPFGGERLYGREGESRRLRAAFEAAAAGASAVVLVGGAAGVGKSALVHELGRQPDVRPGFVWGKPVERQGDVPYGPLLEAFRPLIGRLLDEPGRPADDWRSRLRQALGRNARVACDVIPELEALLGGATPVPPLGPIEAETRFHLTFLALVQALAAGLRPLTLFLDDLQWADPGSLRLLEALAGHPDSRHLLVVVALRGQPADLTGAAAATVAALARGGPAASSIELRPLGGESLLALVADGLRVPPDAGRPLAELVLRKTAGNAFFVVRFLRHLHRSGLLRFDWGAGTWTWNLQAIERVGITENVVELMLEAIRDLPAPTQRLLQMAACVRGRVDLWLLARLAGRREEEIGSDLWGAIREGLLVPDQAGPRYRRPGLFSDGSGPDQSEGLGLTASYRFVHDRVQEAASSLLDGPARQQIHLAIGQQLLQNASPGELDERLFEIVDQLDRGADLARGPDQREQLARLELAAGRKAKGASAFGPALAYLRRGLERLPGASGPAHDDLRFGLQREGAECAFLAGDHLVGDQLAEGALAAARTRFEQAEVFNVRIVACATRVAMDEAITWGRRGLALFDLDLPAAGNPALVGQELEAVQASLAGRRSHDVLEQPFMFDAVQLARMQLLANLLSPAYVRDPMLFGLIVGRMVNLSIEHGNAVHSPFAYTAYGMLLAGLHRDYANAHGFGRLGVELSRRFDDPALECRTVHVFCCFVNHWCAPLNASVSLLRQGVARGLEGGELQFAVIASGVLVLTLYHLGLDLPRILAELEGAVALARRSKVKAGLDYLLAYRQAIRCLQGQTRGRFTFDDDGFDERAHLAAAADNPLAQFLHFVLRLSTSFLFGDLRQALAAADAAAVHAPAVLGILPLTQHNLFTSLALLRLAEGAAPEVRARHLERVAANQAQLAAWAAGCPENFAHLHLLVSAELARCESRAEEAAGLYDQAIDAARRGGFVQDEALGNELAGRFYRARARRRIARLYLRAAVEGYARWGAGAKAAALEEEYPDLLAAELGEVTRPGLVGSGAAAGRTLDLIGLLKAAETISGEVVLDRLLEKLLAVCCEVAGATRGAVALDEEGHLVVHAAGPSGEPAALARTPLAASRDVPRALVRHAHRSEDPLVLGSAARGSPVPDPFIDLHQTRSVLLVPIRRQGRPLGVLYLENHLVDNAFTPDRVRVLQLLSSQIAISVENARLYERAQDSIRQREEFLSVASHELQTPLTALQLAVQGLLHGSQPASGQRIERAVGVAARQTERLSALIDELLDLSRIRAGHLTMFLETVDLAAVVREVTARFEPQLEDAGCRVRLILPGPAAGRWDRRRLEQVVTNLLSNAVKFGRGHPIDVEVRAEPDGTALVVTDRGIGIPAQRIARLFRRFERVDSSPSYGGLGLGLYITRAIVDALGGSVRVESKPGAGATFTVDLPNRGPRPGPVEPRPPAPSPVTPLRPGPPVR